MKLNDAEQVPDITSFHLRRWLLAVGAIAALYLALWYLPSWQVDRELARADDCLQRVDTTGSGDPHECAPELRFARALPWISRHGGMDRDDEIARLALRFAATRDLDRGARDRLANALVTKHGAEVWTAGAFETIAAHASELGKDDLEHGVRAALWAGNRDALDTLARRPPDTSSFRLARLHLVLTCMIGADGHEAALAASDSAGWDGMNRAVGSAKTRAEWIASDRAEAAAIAQICDPGAERASGDRITKAGWLGFVAGTRAPHRIDPSLGTGSGWEAIARIETLLALGDNDPAHYDVELYASGEASSPWQILASAGDDAGSPTRDDAAAGVMFAMANTSTGERARRLHDNGFALALHAAAGWSRVGNVAKARLSLAAASDPSAKLSAKVAAIRRRTLVPYFQLAGDLDAALAASDAAPPPADDPYEADALVARAFVLIARGQIADAFAALAPLPLPGSGDIRENSNHALVEALWLRAALAVRLHVELPSMPAYSEYDSDTSPTFFYRAARATPERQATVRAMTTLPRLSSVAVLPAALYLAGQLAGSGDVEVWLDHVCATDLDDIDPIAYIAARAEAARWRGDGAAATRWDERLVALRRTIHNDAASYLVHLLGAAT
jgi:hypothetical protein